MQVSDTGLYLAGLALSPFLNRGAIKAFFHSVGTLRWCNEAINSNPSEGAISSAHSLSSLGGIWSGPHALCGISHELNSFAIPGLLTVISGMSGYGLRPMSGKAEVFHEKRLNVRLCSILCEHNAIFLQRCHTTVVTA